MKLRTSDPWMPAPAYAKELPGVTVNLVVADVARAVAFQNSVIAAEVVYSDPDFAAVRGYGSQWMLHADHTYDRHPLGASVKGLDVRGIGIEIRVQGRDPDAAEAAARANGYEVLAGAQDKPHGLREAYILDPDGYLWVPGVPPKP